MGDARQVNAHCPRMWRVQKRDKLVAYCGRGIDINAAIQSRQNAMFAGNNLDFWLIHALVVVIEQRNRLLPSKMSGNFVTDSFQDQPETVHGKRKANSG